MLTRFKRKLYNKLVYTYPEVRAHYEGYKDSNLIYHERHRLKSFKFLRKLNKYYKNGKKGSFPSPPNDYTVKGTDAVVYAKRKKPTNQVISDNNSTPSSINKSVLPANKDAEFARKPSTEAESASTVQPVVKLYMDGPESGKARRMDPYHFAVSLLKYDVISFDIFDTLVFRKLNQPEDLSMLVGERLGIFDFYNIRKKSEEEAHKCKNSEVTIEEIYERVAYYTDIDAKKGAETEFEIELDMCFANPYMLRVFEILRASGKRIVAISNMYLQKEKMEKLLKICGYDGFENIFISCDYHCGKVNGELFRIMQKKIGDSSIVHIGTDIKEADKTGIESKYYQACRDLGDPHRSIGISHLIESAYRGIVNTTLHNGTETFSPLWEYGFIYGGLATIGYVHWIHTKAIENGITKILFLSKDGFLLKKIYDELFDDIQSEYVFWSKITAYRVSSIGERESFLKQVVVKQCESNRTVGEVLEWVGLENLEDLFYKERILPECIISKNNVQIICDIFVKNWDKVEEAMIASKTATRKYVKGILGDHRNIAIVDAGWSAQRIHPLISCLNSLGDNNDSINIKIYMMGLLTTKENGDQISNENIECYMCNASYNREIYDRMRKDYPLSLEIMETMFNAPQCIFLGFPYSGEMEFSPQEKDDYSCFKKIEKGIFEFCLKYYEAFKKYPYLLNIDGYDAFIPIKLLLNNKKDALQLIGSLICNDGTFLPTEKIC